METRSAIAVVAILYSLNSVSASEVKTCDAGWFGSLCQYKCRCTYDNCDQQGSCLQNTVCKKGWFGPQCQYGDLASNRSRTRELTDGDDNTCLTSGDTAEVTLDKAYVFTWLRVQFLYPGQSEGLRVSFSNNVTHLSCSDQRALSLDQRTLDIYCDLSDTFDMVNFSGHGVRHLCSAYISGGRNVALRQRAEQSSAHSENFTKGIIQPVNTADNLVDGNRFEDFHNYSYCSVTNTTNASWTVSLLQPRIVTTYVMHGKRGKDFSLDSYDPNGTSAFHYEDMTSDINLTGYSVLSFGVQLPVSWFTVEFRNLQPMFALCEIEVYGDSMCETGSFGRDCEFKCYCELNKTCVVSTGHCLGECAAGFHGQSCNESCLPGTYGQGCASICSASCLVNEEGESNPCHEVTGSCFLGCSPGYTGSDCLSDDRHHKYYNLIVGLSVIVIPLGLVCVALLAVFLRCRPIRRAQNALDIPDNKTESVQPQSSRMSSTGESETVSIDKGLVFKADKNPEVASQPEKMSVKDISEENRASVEGRASESKKGSKAEEVSGEKDVDQGADESLKDDAA